VRKGERVKRRIGFAASSFSPLYIRSSHEENNYFWSKGLERNIG
jgi:hypothetical protein